MNMPMLDGIKTVQEIKKESAYDPISIVMFSTAKNIKEKDQLKSMGVAFFTKPCSYSEMREVARELARFCT
jgi:CheY-like chemotaxis protein